MLNLFRVFRFWNHLLDLFLIVWELNSTQIFKINHELQQIFNLVLLVGYSYYHLKSLTCVQISQI